MDDVIVVGVVADNGASEIAVIIFNSLYFNSIIIMGGLQHKLSTHEGRSAGHAEQDGPGMYGLRLLKLPLKYMIENILGVNILRLMNVTSLCATYTGP